MAKDPAVLFYTQDFLVGTMTMSYEQKGKYITLLCLQHQKGKLTLKDLQAILTDEDYEVAEKFIKDTDGFYYNEKLRYEAERRKSYSESRRRNLMKKHMNSHLETVTGTVTVTDTVELELVTGTKAERQDMLAEVITGNLDKEQKQMMHQFDNLFGEVK